MLNWFASSVRYLLRNIILWAMRPRVRMYVVPGGRQPERKTDGAIGYDAFVRAIVSKDEMDPEHPHLRKTIFDFREPKKENPLRRNLHLVNGKWIYQLNPGERVLVGIGFIPDMSFPLFYWVAPRSGLATKLGITLANAPGTVDPDYRGEAGVIVTNQGDKPFDLEHEMRIAQIIYNYAIIPDIESVADYEKLSKTDRSAGGFGSTGYSG